MDTLEKCDGCGDAECPDKHLCDVKIPNHPIAPKARTAENVAEWEAEIRHLYADGPEPARWGTDRATAQVVKDRWLAGETITSLERDASIGLTRNQVRRVLEDVTPEERATRPEVKIERGHPRAEVEALHERVAQALREAPEASYRALAKQLRCTTHTVHRVARERHLERSQTPQFKHPQELVDRAHDLRTQGMSFRDIAKELRLSSHTQASRLCERERSADVS